MPRISPPPPAARTTTSDQARAPQPAPAQLSANQAWAGSQGASATERREKATGVSTAQVELSEAQRTEVVQKKGTCPFIGTGVATGALPVRNSADKPLASIDDVAKLGNTGKGSDLGELLKSSLRAITASCRACPESSISRCHREPSASISLAPRARTRGTAAFCRATPGPRTRGA